MGTVCEKVKYINETKNLIKKALKKKGVSIYDKDTFRSYAQKIEEMGGGGSDSFEAQLLLDNVVHGGNPKTEEQITNEALPILQSIVGGTL